MWNEFKFNPNENQETAIRSIDGPLFLTAGPGSGKTRILLWRTVNLILEHNVNPDDIYLSTFTKKAAKQLKDGLQTILGMVTNKTNVHFDLGQMFVGTIHSLCQKLISDRRFTEGVRHRPPVLIDQLSQYFMIYNLFFWKSLIKTGNYETEEEAQRDINVYFGNTSQYNTSRHEAVQNCIKLFNRLSEEDLDSDKTNTSDNTLKRLLSMYSFYRETLKTEGKVDLSLIQQYAYRSLCKFPGSENVFKHVIIDEYQDTNAIQEKLIFHLAKGHKNLCVVGDDDQALYRFRGATVENLVEFEDRCLNALGKKPKRINLSINYRSRQHIVELYNKFMENGDWKHENGNGHYRIMDKEIEADRKDEKPSAVVKTNAGKPEEVCEEIANLLKQLKKNGTITDYNQVAILFPAVKDNTRVKRFTKEFIGADIPIYAPRAKRFLEVEESIEIYGIFLSIFGQPNHPGSLSRGIQEFRKWQDKCILKAESIIKKDPLLKSFIEAKQAELKTIVNDYETLCSFIENKKLRLEDTLNVELLTALTKASISEHAKGTLCRKFFYDLTKQRIEEKKPLTIKYAVNRATSVDWTLLDLFYQILSFGDWNKKIELNPVEPDEAPLCNLAQISQYISRYMEDNRTVLSGSFLRENHFINSFFSSYTYALYRLGESEYEDEENPFPKGRVSFLTIHQSKGLEFPVVILGNLYRGEHKPDRAECVAREFSGRNGEPLDKIASFDNMRMFYVALSRAKNLLVLPHFSGRGQRMSKCFMPIINKWNLPLIQSAKDVPKAGEDQSDIIKNYSYTADYLYYHQCPRKYMIFRKYGFAPSTVQTISFGSLVHNTIEDFHWHLINLREKREKGQV